ncbi:MAG: acetate--CoA ligase [Candidatus Heimdallarchaeota archaeon]|nr:acetate--CoA ligase [Candidatus Heimdallarchaeota archaeon]
MSDDEIVKSEVKIYHPSEDIIKLANVKEYEETYKRSITDPEGFWGEQAETLSWYKKWDKVLDDSKKPFFKWFVGGKTNIVHNAIDRHLTTATRNKLAFIWEGEPGDTRTFSYHALNREVSKMANIVKSMGIRKGDIVTIYMPQIPELIFAMLACAKIGAAHSVVYAGFSSKALKDRIEDAKSKLLITADGGWRRGKIVDLKNIVNDALEDSPTIEKSIVVKRTCQDVDMVTERDFWYHELEKEPFASKPCQTEVMDAEDMLFILYTSGTTGRPKGVLHTHGGYSLYTSTVHRMVFDIKDEDRWWCLADPGWITGHSFIVYAPLINGTTTMLYEGAPTYPNPDRIWEMVDKYGVNVFYTSPTAVRGFMRFGDSWVKQHDLSTLRLLGSVGEPINPAAWEWYYNVVGGARCPIMDTWWQTETGGFMISPYPITPLKPGSATRPLFGIAADVIREDGTSTDPDEEGILVIKAPWPGMARTIMGDDARYKDVYWSDYEKQGWYKAGDSARKDADGYIWVIARLDDVLKVSGYRLGTAEVESALVSHEKVAESAVIGLPHELRGNAIHAFCILAEGNTASSDLEKEIKEHVRDELGPIAVPEKINFVNTLPKTRSGKIMRRVLKAKALGQDPGDLSTIED